MICLCEMKLLVCNNPYSVTKFGENNPYFVTKFTENNPCSVTKYVDSLYQLKLHMAFKRSVETYLYQYWIG